MAKARTTISVVYEEGDNPEYMKQIMRDKVKDFLKYPPQPENPDKPIMWENHTYTIETLDS